MHSVKVICNLFVVIMENCFGITERNHDVHSKLIDDQIVSEDLSYLNIMDKEREDVETRRDRRFKTMIIPKQQAMAAALEAEVMDGGIE